MKHRVLIVEDHHLLRQGLRAMVAALPDFDVIAEAKDGKEAIRQAVSLQPDLILMDLSLPLMTGIEATSQIKARLPHIRIIALTAFKTEEYVHEALRAGVDGYVMKDVSYEELLAALRSVMAGKKFLSPGCVRSTGQHLSSARYDTSFDLALGEAHGARARHSEVDRGRSYQPQGG